MIDFTKTCIDASNKCEACSVFDVNNDGILDIVCGEYWYQGPDFIKKHKICDITYQHEYVWDFCNYPMDVNKNGYLDIITGSWWGGGLFYRENPGNGGEWETKKICDLSNVETIRLYDIDGDGEMEIFPNCPGEPVFFIKLEPGGGHKKYVVSEKNAGHGLGVGDIDGDGKLEIITPGGIYHMPPGGPLAGLWGYSPEFDLGSTSVPILVHDVNKDGVNDLIFGAGHDYGLFWLQQKKDPDGSRTWEKHVIDAAWSQYHDLQLADINNDGELELVTGKRYKAHNGNDPGDAREVFICCYTFVDNKMYRHIIEYGDPEKGASGVGIYFWMRDMTGNNKLDIIAPGKEGLYLFTQ
ncbi:MAG: VCBS repeat-containing protein [Defluviitaleaceae bacterium]|nr:VCBS repeat-containing protein [Defluviitaleaceae bacterium]